MSVTSITSGSSKRSRSSSTAGMEKRYFCQECGEGFARNFNLKSHVSCKHKGEKPLCV
jgi:uncharacterized Zn-finger protein